MKCLNATYNIFLQNCLNTSNYPKHMFLPFFSETFGQFQPFPMDASVAFGGSDFLH